MKYELRLKKNHTPLYRQQDSGVPLCNWAQQRLLQTEISDDEAVAITIELLPTDDFDQSFSHTSKGTTNY